MQPPDSPPANSAPPRAPDGSAAVGPAVAPKRSRTRIVLAASALVVAGAALVGAAVLVRTPREVRAVYTIERDGLRYEFHAVTGAESLWRTDARPGQQFNLIRDRAGDGRRLRRELEKELGVESLDELREEHRDVIEHLRELGYI